MPGIFYPPLFSPIHFQDVGAQGNIVPSSKESSREADLSNSTHINSSVNPVDCRIDDDQQYESASMIYGPGIQWPPSPSPLHQATQAAMQYPPYIDYYGDYQNEGM